MDPRIQEKIDLLKQKKQEELEQAAQQAEELRLFKIKHIEDSLSKARKWVQDNLFDMIAHKTVNNQEKIIRLNSSLFSPVEALVKAVEEIDGIKVISIYVPEWTGHCNSDEIMETIESHYEYYANWE